jgi:hypothetical protein
VAACGGAAGQRTQDGAAVCTSVCLSVCLVVSWCVHAAAVYPARQHRGATHVRVRCEQVLRMLQEGFGYHIRLIDSMVRVWVWRRLVG